MKIEIERREVRNSLAVIHRSIERWSNKGASRWYVQYIEAETTEKRTRTHTHAQRTNATSNKGK